jgi:flavin-binding protein dodecin
MSVAKVIEVSSASEKSFEDAINAGIQRANETLKDVKGAWIKEHNVVIENGKIKEYRVDMKITFVLHKP